MKLCFSSLARNCAELYKSAMRVSGVYTIDPDGSGAFDVYCDQTTSDGGWTVFQRRLDGSVDFNRTWNEYKYGFGNYLKGEFWLGFDKIRRLTRNETKNRLRVDLGVAPSKAVHAEYEWFGLGEEKDKYRLSLGNLSGKSIVSLFIIRSSRGIVEVSRRNGSNRVKAWLQFSGLFTAIFFNYSLPVKNLSLLVSTTHPPFKW